MNTEEFSAICKHLAPLISEARYTSAVIAERMLALDKRYETIFVATRAAGKSTIASWAVFAKDEPICAVGGFYDPSADQLLLDVRKTVTAMHKLHRNQRTTLPKYKPKIFLRSEVWQQVRDALHWIRPHEVAQMEFPRDAFYAALRSQGASPEALEFFGPAWLKSCEDASGRVLPGFAFDAMAETVARSNEGPNQAKWKGYATAAAKLVRTYPDLSHWLSFLVPDDRGVYSREEKLTVQMERVVRRFKQARWQNKDIRLPEDMSGPQFVKHLEHAGIWARNSKNYLVFARPYAVGSTYLKSTLTVDALQRMLSE